MKLLVAGMGVVVSVAMMTGCGPGLSHRQANAPMTPDTSDVLASMNAELSQTIVGTTTTTSAESLPMPESRMPVAAVREPVVAAAPTWGASGEAIGEPEPAGLAAASPASASAKNADFDMHPYDKPDLGSFDQHPYD